MENYNQLGDKHPLWAAELGVQFSITHPLPLGKVILEAGVLAERFCSTLGVTAYSIQHCRHHTSILSQLEARKAFQKLLLLLMVSLLLMSTQGWAETE